MRLKNSTEYRLPQRSRCPIRAKGIANGINVGYSSAFFCYFAGQVVPPPSLGTCIGPDFQFCFACCRFTTMHADSPTVSIPTMSTVYDTCTPCCVAQPKGRDDVVRQDYQEPADLPQGRSGEPSCKCTWFQFSFGQSLVLRRMYVLVGVKKSCSGRDLEVCRCSSGSADSVSAASAT